MKESFAGTTGMGLVRYDRLIGLVAAIGLLGRRWVSGVRILVFFNLIRLSDGLQYEPEHQTHSCKTETQHFAKYSIYLAKLADRPSSHPE
jgi:hypothetical protein